MSLRRCLPPSLLAALLVAMSGVAFAAPGGGRGAPPPPVDRGNDSRPRDDDGLSDSVRRVERTTRGQVLSAERVPFDGRDVNRIKTVDDRGRVRVFMDDPQTVPTPPPEPPPN